AVVVEGRIEKGLTQLKNMAHLSPVPDRFAKTRDTTVKALHKFCRLTKGTELKDSVQNLTDLRKAVKAITVVMESLGTGPFPTTEPEVDLTALNGVDTAGLDQRLVDPHF